MCEADEQSARVRRYTFVTIGPGGARVYVGGAPVATTSTITYPSAAFAAPWTRFYFGDMYNAGASLNITVHDIQLYDRELSPGQVASLSRGLGFVC